MGKYFLYIDILGFSDLVKSKSSKIDELYKIIASLNAHRHDFFKTIIFSDTILIYNTAEPVSEQDCSCVVMYLCEFVHDLFIRLAGRNIFYRAIITKGQFIHYEINGIPCFYGSALIDTYNSEKEIQAIGLFIDKSCVRYCDIFHYCDFNDNYNFVFITQTIEMLETIYQGEFPISENEVEQTDLGWLIMPEIISLGDIYNNSLSHIDIKIKQKNIETFKIYEKKYPKTIKQLIDNNFTPNFISPRVNWGKITERYPEDYSYIRRIKK